MYSFFVNFLMQNFQVVKPIKLFLLFIISSPLLYAQPAGEFIPPKIQLTDSVFCTEIKDQGQSPTCWVFGTNSLFESDYFKKYNYTINLSEMFIARYAYIDKAKMYLKTKGRTYYKGGGQFHDVIRVVNNYGIVPQEVYRGIPDNGVSHNHAKLDTAMIRFARRLLRQGKKVMGVKELKQINDTLDRYLGKVPATFWYNMNQFT